MVTPVKLALRLKARLCRRAVTTQQCAYAMGSDLFGRLEGAADLALRRKQVLAEVWTAKQKAKQ